jgi:hypothetical protein
LPAHRSDTLDVPSIPNAPENPLSNHQEDHRRLIELSKPLKQSSADLSIPNLNGASHEHPLSGVSKETSIESEDHVHEDCTNLHMVENKFSDDQALEAQLQEAVRAQAGSHSQNEEEGEVGEDVSIDHAEIEMSFAPDSNQLAPESPANPTQDAEQSPANSPVLNRHHTDVEDDYEPPEATSPVVNQTIIAVEDDYEPPDATPLEPMVTESPPFSPAPPAVIDEYSIGDEEMLEVDLREAVNKQSAGATAVAPDVSGWLQPAVGVILNFPSWKSSLG